MIAALEKLGAKVSEVSLPHNDSVIGAYYILAPAEASSNLARYDGVHYGYRSPAAQDILSVFARSRAEGFGAEVQRRILLGTYVLSSGYYEAYYLKAAKVRRLILQDFDAAFKKVDFLIGPTTPGPAFGIGERVANPLEMYLADIYTISSNLAGGPAISVPCGFTRAGLPIGAQIMANALEEPRLLQLARAYERETNWREARRPSL
jgi:aspartyl-tRNA(Asn)/glutamyl-tRNA(Gln) amidotransferase subunit A